MKFRKYISLSLLGAVIACLSACNDDNNIGSSITKGEVTIEIDSLFTISGKSVRAAEFDSRDSTLLLGNLAAEGYGTLDCAYTGQLMPASALNIPDSIGLDDISDMKIKLKFNPGAYAGDSLSPQQLTVYRLTKELPADLNNLSDLQGYYNSAAPMGSKMFTAASVESGTSKSVGTVAISLGKDFARELINQYRTTPAIFQRPDSFIKKFPGILVRSTFGNGLVVNMRNTEFTTYYNYTKQVTVVRDGKSVKIDSLFTDSTTLLSISPEVLSASLVRLEPAQSLFNRVEQGQCVLQSPGGFNVQVRFPADQIIDRYYSEDFNLSVVNSLSYTVPAYSIPNDYDLSVSPYLLMIKTKEMHNFFSQNMLPAENDTNCFYAPYNASTQSYTFQGMRQYIIDLMQKGGSVAEEDMQFTLIPVRIKTETIGSEINNTLSTVVTQCSYYIAKPTLCRLDIAGSTVKFTYSRQLMK